MITSSTIFAFDEDWSFEIQDDGEGQYVVDGPMDDTDLHVYGGKAYKQSGV